MVTGKVFPQEQFTDGRKRLFREKQLSLVHKCNKVRRKEGSGQGWLVKTQVFLIRQINSHRCALCVTRKHQLSRLSQQSLSVFVPTVSL